MSNHVSSVGWVRNAFQVSHIGIGIGKLPSKLERGVVGTTTGEQTKT